MGVENVRESPRSSLATNNYDNVAALAHEGEASTLDLERARTDVARSQQDLADAESNLWTARRRLQSKSGVVPTAATQNDIPVDDLRDEGPLDAWANQNADTRPAIVQAKEARDAAGKSLNAARAAWLPTISATASEQYTNATENLGRKDFYALLGLATWHLDIATPANVRAHRAALDAARAHESQARIDAQDAVYFAWLSVRTDLQKTKLARVQEDAAARAAHLAVANATS